MVFCLFCDWSFHFPSLGIHLGEFIHLNEIMQKGGRGCPEETRKEKNHNISI